MWKKPEPKTYYDSVACKKRIEVHQGGTSSGKTYSLLKVLLRFAYQNRNNNHTVISIVRKTVPALKKSVYRDFYNILEADNIPHESNKTELTCKVYNSTFEFIGLDDPQKARGPRRHVLYCNEANELTFEDFRQLMMRTKLKVIVDFNPSEEFWAHTDLVDRPDVAFFKSNFTHNPYLDPAIRREIERLKDIDPNYWRIYGLGELGIIEGVVFPNFEIIPEWPSGLEYYGYGLDFGYTNDPSALIKMAEKKDCLFMDEKLYRRSLTNDDLCHEFTKLGITSRDLIVADSAEPKSIEEIKRKGFFVQPALKGPDSLINGIDIMKRYKLCVTAESLNLIKELKNYKWQQDKAGQWLNRPIDRFNHLLDGGRYWCLNNLNVVAPRARLISY